MSQLIGLKLSNLSGVKTQINKAIEKVLRFGPQHFVLFIMLIATIPRGFTSVIYCSARMGVKHPPSLSGSVG